jgi:solute carrier family 6 amino acid transporter-like protein 5/7/9/14
VTTDEDEESGPQRQQWASGMEYIMSCIAMSFGLGKIWRFPYLTYTNGGVAFIIPYVLAHFFISKPLYYFEMCIGQFVSRGPVKVWALSPALKGKLTAGNVKAVCATNNMLFP